MCVHVVACRASEQKKRSVRYHNITALVCVMSAGIDIPSNTASTNSGSTTEVSLHVFLVKGFELKVILLFILFLLTFYHKQMCCLETLSFMC